MKCADLLQFAITQLISLPHSLHTSCGFSWQKETFLLQNIGAFFSSKYDIALAQLREFSEKNVDEKNVKEGSDYV
jgi:hypothetical protein